MNFKTKEKKKYKEKKKKRIYNIKQIRSIHDSPYR